MHETFVTKKLNRYAFADIHICLQHPIQDGRFWGSSRMGEDKKAADS